MIEIKEEENNIEIGSNLTNKLYFAPTICLATYIPKMTIQDVINQLDLIIQDALQNNSPLGIFPALYRQVTLNVAEGIQKNRFEDNVRMEKLDVVFAKRYLDAYEAHHNNQSVTKSWQLAFDTAQESSPVILQHLLLGINAHINLDLGIAAAEVAQGRSIEDLQVDFMAINQLLLDMMDEVQASLNSLSPALWLLDWIGQRNDEKLASFSLQATRTFAWSVAKQLSNLPPEVWPNAIDGLDKTVAGFGEKVLKPKGFLWAILSVVKRWEEQDNETIIRRIGV